VFFIRFDHNKADKVEDRTLELLINRTNNLLAVLTGSRGNYTSKQDII